MGGQTVLLDLHDIASDLLSSEEIIRLLLVRAVEEAGLTPVKHTIQVIHFPSPIKGDLRGGYGLSGGMVLVESHIYIHTWPEKGYARLELSSCKRIKLEPFLTVIRVIFGSQCSISYSVIDWQTDVT